MIIDFKTAKETPNRVDRQGNPITNPLVLAEIERLEAIPKAQRKAKENIRLNGLLKNGDAAKNKSILERESKKHQAGRKPTQEAESLAELNTPKAQNKDKSPLDEARAIIDAIYNGTNPIKAIKDSTLTPRQFYNLLDEQTKDLKRYIEGKSQPFILTNEEREQIKSLKKDFLHARAIFAEFCLYRREELEKQLLSGDIDTSTYSALSADYKYLAGKFAPAIYGDKISIDTTTTHNVNHSINTEQVKSLNALLNKGFEAIDAQFEEIPQIEDKRD